jgi:hypothetical protein
MTAFFISFFRNNGFLNTQLRYMIPKAPWLLSCNLSLTQSLNFFLFKGASKFDIAKLSGTLLLCLQAWRII